MPLPSELLEPDDRIGLAKIMAEAEADPQALREIVAELVISRKVLPEIRRSRYLMANPAVRKIIDLLPGSRSVPMAPIRK